jgi:hypothetical protein
VGDEDAVEVADGDEVGVGVEDVDELEESGMTETALSPRATNISPLAES